MTLSSLFFIALVSAVTLTSGYPCDPEEYVAIYSNCVNGQRNATYYALFDCDAPDREYGISCDCTQFDYWATYSLCTPNWRRTESFEKRTDCTGGVPPPEPREVLCPCRRDDLDFTFGICDPKTQTRKLVLYFKHECEGGYSLPAAKVVPCGFSCGAGSKLDIFSATCVPCQAGTHSLGGGSIWNSFYGNWPSMFNTTCSLRYAPTGTRCQPWQRNGTFIESGNQDEFNNVQSDLTLTADLVMPGYVEFAYRVDAEKGWDGLTLTIDGTEVMPLVSFQPSWTTVRYNLTQGLHEIVWRYTKDFSQSRGLDRAFIQKIVLRGTAYADMICSPCPEGYSSPARAGQCGICPRDTYAPEYGTSSCIPCDDGKYSYAGAKECLPKPPCTEDDYEMLYSECVAGERTKYYSWHQPHVCDDSCPTCKKLPEAETGVDCAPCNPGEELASDRTCKLCPQGSWSTGGDSVCQVCPGGSVAPLAQNYRYFEKLPPGVTSACSGACGSVWRPLNERLDSGDGHTGVVDVELLWPVDFAVDGTISFEASITANYPSTYFHFFVDDYTEMVLSRLAPYLAFETRIDAGHHVLRFAFTKEYYEAGEEREYAELRNVVMKGTSTGGAMSCTECLPGTAAPMGGLACAPCLPGEYSAGNTTACSKCPADTWADQEGSTTCEECGAGTFSAEGSTDCESTCTYQFDNQTIYNLTALSRVDHMYGPMTDNTTRYSYYLNVCSKQHTNHSCYDTRGNPIPSFACQELPFLGYSVNAGDRMAILPLEGRPRMGLTLLFFHGDSCGPSVRRQSNVTMLCDHEAGVGFPVLGGEGTAVEDPMCHYHFTWVTQYACPLCTAADLQAFEGPCEGGQKITHYAYRQPQMCYGGIQPPEALVEQCAVQVAFPIWVIVIVGVVFLAVIALIVLCWLKNRQLTQKYHLLKDQSDNYRLSDLTSTALEEEDTSAAARPSDQDSHRGRHAPSVAVEVNLQSDDS